MKTILLVILTTFSWSQVIADTCSYDCTHHSQPQQIQEELPPCHSQQQESEEDPEHGSECCSSHICDLSLNEKSLFKYEIQVEKSKAISNDFDPTVKNLIKTLVSQTGPPSTCFQTIKVPIYLSLLKLKIPNFIA